MNAAKPKVIHGAVSGVRHSGQRRSIALMASQAANTARRMLSTLLSDWPGSRRSGCRASKGATSNNRPVPAQATLETRLETPDEALSRETPELPARAAAETDIGIQRDAAPRSLPRTIESPRGKARLVHERRPAESTLFRANPRKSSREQRLARVNDQNSEFRGIRVQWPRLRRRKALFDARKPHRSLRGLGVEADTRGSPRRLSSVFGCGGKRWVLPRGGFRLTPPLAARLRHLLPRNDVRMDGRCRDRLRDPASPGPLRRSTQRRSVTPPRLLAARSLLDLFGCGPAGRRRTAGRRDRC